MIRKLLLSLIIPLAAAAEPIKIGVSVPLSGEAATYGVDIKNAIVFANDELAAGRYQLVVEDDMCSDRQAVTVAQKLANIDKVKYVLGFGCSGIVDNYGFDKNGDVLGEKITFVLKTIRSGKPGRE